MDSDVVGLLCKSPYSVGYFTPVPCGKCRPCRVNIRRVWTLRIVLESLCHQENSFLTLTYDDSHLPPGGTLVPRDAKLFMYRLRTYFRRKTGRNIRFYLVGEYGDKSWRPHYHAALFGLGPDHQDVVAEAWRQDGVSFGFSHLGDLTHDSAQYIAGYVVKKLTAKSDPRLMGRHPEFSRQSNRPGIAFPAVEAIAKACRNGELPGEIRLNGRLLPVGRYIRNKLVDALGIDQDKCKVDYAKEMQSLWTTITDIEKEAALTPAALVVHRNRGRVLQMEAKFKHSEREKLL